MPMLTRWPSRQESNASKDIKPKPLEDPELKGICDITTEVLKVWLLPDTGPALPVQEEHSGLFFSDEKYVVLKTSNHNRKLVRDLYFWIGSEAAKRITPDPPERVAQLMTLLNHDVIVHREIGGFESPRFRSYFKTFCVLRGNKESVFNPDDPSKYRKRLLRFTLNNKGRMGVKEVDISRNSLFKGDVFIFDEGTKMTQWNGTCCDQKERDAARKYIASALKIRKTKCSSEFIDEEDLMIDNELYRKLGNNTVFASEAPAVKKDFKKSMLRLSEQSKKPVLIPVSSEKIFRSDIKEGDDIVLVNTFNELLICIGTHASELEKTSVWPMADKYLKETNMPNKSIAVFNAGTYCLEYESSWNE